jgi:tetratricopeptide (TPR) repeat protein
MLVQTLLPWTNVNVRGGLQQIMSTLPESMLTPAIIIISELSCCGSQDISTRQLTSLVDVYQPVGIIEFFTSHGIITSGISPDSVHIEPMTSTMVRRELKCMRIFPIHLESFLHLVDSKWTRDLNDFNAVQQDSSYFFHAISGLNALTELCTEDQILRSGLNIAVSMTIRIVRLLTEMGLHVRAKHMMQKILEWGPEFFSSDRIAHTAVRRRLAVVERYIGRFQAAESIEYDVIELDLKALGESGVVSMCSLNNYALTLQSQGKFAKSERAHLIALSKKEERLGRDHPDTLMSVSDLGQCLQHLGQHISAESLIRRALSGRQILFTPTHPAILRSMNKLGLKYLSQNRYEEAENMHRLCLFRREELLGQDHLDTIRSKSNLAIALTHRGSPKEAERLLRDVMVGFNSLLGPDQPEAIKAYQNLGRFLRDQKRYREAEKIFQVCRSRAELSLGCAHPRTVDTWRELAIVLHWQEKYFKALKFAIRVRDVQIKLFGYDNSATCDSIQHVEQLRPLL